MADGASKRKQPSSNSGPGPKRPRLTTRPQHHIAAQPTKSAYPNGEINVKNFLKSHENEITTLENAMRAAKKGLSRRAFQDVPRELRRRTASHNPQRVPKKLRARAGKEAKEDNTPIARGKSGSGVGKGPKKHLRQEGQKNSRQKAQQRAKKNKVDERTEGDNDDMGLDTPAAPVAKPSPPKTKLKPKFPSLATPATPPSRFRRRQKNKTWLPTHVWHSKRARMTEPKDPLWGFAIPLQPAVKAYRLTHRAATQRGAVGWDTSYMATIGLEGSYKSVDGMLKGLHYGSGEREDPWDKNYKWQCGKRTWEGWLYEREAKPLKRIAPVTVIHGGGFFCGHKTFIRVHPSAFHKLWNELIRIAKVQKPSVVVQDLRFEIGSIEIMGPAAAETLCSVLSPDPRSDSEYASQIHAAWRQLAPVNDVGSLPDRALLAFDASDPRFRDPIPTAQLQQDEESLRSLTTTLAKWPVDKASCDDGRGPCLLFERRVREAVQRCMPSEKSINRRKSACTLGEPPEARSTDPQIPTLVLTSRESKSWTVLLPWKCVQPVWRCMMRYAVSTGGNPRFGGLKERRQVNFERSLPLFPFDHPGTDAGWAWELRERKAREHEWTKRPKGKRIEWPTIDLGNGRKGEVGDPWACDWERLLLPSTKTSNERDEAASPVLQLSSKQAREAIACSVLPDDLVGTNYIFTVKITMMQRGVPTDCTRIYRLPSNNPDLRSAWLSLTPKPGTKRQPRKHRTSYSSDAPEHIKRRDLARSLLEPPPPVGNELPKAGEDGYPVVPDEEDLIGFVTTGNFNLAEGMPTAVANLALQRVVRGRAEGWEMGKEERMCVVRPAGSPIGRLAVWEVV